jgi:AraC family transcriptional activator FtrA
LITCHVLWQGDRVPIRNVAIVALPGVQPFELGVAWEGFGIDRSDEGVPIFDCAVVAMTNNVPTAAGFSLSTPHRLDRAREADLVIVPANVERTGQAGPVLDLLRESVARGAKVMSVCSGAFVLGAAGLLDGRECTTHWRYARELSERFPLARVDPDVLFVCDGPVLTSAGTAAGLDLCLHIIRSEYGEEIARKVARRMVMPPHRDGGQAQYAPPAPPADALDGLLEWAGARLGTSLSVGDLAARLSVSQRTLARRFTEQLGTSPGAWLLSRRVAEARTLLEETDLPVEAVAARVGLTSAVNLRRRFRTLVGTTPGAYRRAFSSGSGTGSGRG